MGACCSTQVKYKGRRSRHDNDNLVEKEEEGHEKDLTTIEHGGAIVRLQGSSSFTSMYTCKGKKGINQDAMTVREDEHLIISNLGDYRKILCTSHNENQLVPIQLTVDLKPSIPSEADRIRKCSGRVFAIDEEPNVPRVWMPNQDCPGLAMARAFGDFCLKDHGLSSIPEVSYRRLTSKDEFVVLATDGIRE